MKQRLQPLKLRHKKFFRSKPVRKGAASLQTNGLMPFSLGLMALSASLVKEAQILAAWQSILKKIKKNGKCVLHGYPTSITTQRKDGGRMGGGKGVEKIFAWPAQPGKLFCEVVSLRPELAAQALRSAQQRLPIKTKIIRSH